MKRTKKLNFRWDTMKILAAGFLGTIFLGGVLLWLPICNTKPITFLDALFTSTTAVCVTGLVTITPATQFTLLGKIILLILIQIGGLGVVACTVGFFMLLKKRITVKERVIIQETYGMDGPGGMVKLIVRVIKGTFLVEGIGAVCYAFQFIPEFGVVKGIWYSIFHAVSAFCNAGIDILGDSSFIRYEKNLIINFTTMGLIVVSGLGFLVWKDLKDNIMAAVRKEMSWRKIWRNFQLHTKIVLVMTAILIVTGTVITFVMEVRNPRTFQNMTVSQMLMASMFHSISTRTAGFATLPQGALTGETLFTSCILMFIGGSPGGTAGGVKTTTIAMLLLTCRATLKGKNNTECFGKKIDSQNIRTGFMVFTVAFTMLLVGTSAIMMIEGDKVSFIQVLYETTSAIGTVGLTADFTPISENLTRIILILMMYIGRIGPVTMALVFGGRTDPSERLRELPTKRILVG